MNHPTEIPHVVPLMLDRRRNKATRIIIISDPIIIENCSPLSHTTNSRRVRLPRSQMKSRDDWLCRPQHQHHAAACFMLAAGAASSSQLATACLEISSNLQSYTVDCASIDPLLSELNGSWMGPTACHATQPCFPSSHSCSMMSHASEISRTSPEILGRSRAIYSSCQDLKDIYPPPLNQ